MITRLPRILAISALAALLPTRAEPPTQALARFETAPGLTVELVAAEPTVVAPCAIAWDESGTLWVAENRGYPTGSKDGRRLGRIARLTDSHGDGRWDQRTDFATGLSFPNGILPWRGGIIVTCAPDVLWLKDTDGDGRADVREILLTGFSVQQSTQLRVNRPLLGPDGWVYLASGLSGGRITSPRRPGDQPLDLRGDLRFNPDTGAYQPVDGPSQFGQDIDDYGRRFGCHNRVQVRHFVLPSHRASRHPFLIAPGVFQDCPERPENPFLRGGGGAAPLYPISSNLTTADSHAGTFTAACGVLLWPDASLPEPFREGVFSCDPTANLVHFDRLQPQGATFAARSVTGTHEFLRSSDNAFRPVYLAQGPDDSLYIADMSRRTIEHPDYLPEEVRLRTDFESGRDMGRIWRVRPARVESTGKAKKSSPPRRWMEPMPSSNIALLGEVSSTNRWRRDTAFRLLRERSSDTNLPVQTRQALNACRTPLTAARLLLLLDHLGALDPDAILGAFAAPMPELRELGVRLSEPFIARVPAIAHAAAAMATDDSPRVRFQNALVLGTLAVDSPQVAIPALAEIARRDGADAWTRTAVLSSVHLQERHFLNALLTFPPATADPVLPVLEDLGGMLGRMLPSDAHVDVLRMALDRAFQDPSRALVLLGAVADAAPSIPTPFPALADQAGVRPGWDGLCEVALGALQRDDTLPILRIAAARLGGSLPPAPLAEVLPRILRAPGPTPLLAAAARLGSAPPLADITSSTLSPEVWNLLPAPNRGVILAALLTRSAHLPHVVEALAAGTVRRHELTAGQRTQLLRIPDPQLRSNVVSLLQPPPTQNRRSALNAAKPALELPGHATRGRALFRDRCAPCHRLDGEGVAVGPDLFDVRNQSRETLLLHILMPSQEIAPPFVQYRAETRSGRVVSGLLAADTASGIVLRQAHGLLEKMSRNELLRLEPMAESFMPEGLENGWTHQDLADLLAFLKGSAN